MILVTSAGGKTGRHIIASLVAQGQRVRALRHSEKTRDRTEKGVQDIVVGDMLDPASLKHAMEGIEAVVHIGPAMHPKETLMGENVIDAARAQGVRRFVYSSVAHPQIEALLNHRAKLEVERYLIESRLSFTILQPMHYMQNVRVPEVVEKGFLTLPYSLDVRMSFVDLADVGAAVVKVLSEEGHERATYELCGPDYLSYREVADLIGRESGKRIAARRASVDAVLEHDPYLAGRGDYAVLALQRLFHYYDRYGLSANSNVLRWLLDRAPGTYQAYVRRELAAPTAAR